MGSKNQIAAYRGPAATRLKPFSHFFRVSSSDEQLPSEELDSFAHRSLQNENNEDFISRRDLLRRLRALKLIEEIVLSRSTDFVKPLKFIKS